MAAPALAEPFSSRQEEVLDVVETVFLREGIERVRVGELAAEASCSRSTLYELAPSKEELLLLVLDRMLRRIMWRGAEAIERAEDPVGRVQAMLTSGALDFATLGPQFLEAVRQHPATRRLFEQRIAESQDTLERLIEDAVSAGKFRPVDAEIVAEAIIAVVMRFTDPAPRSRGRNTPARLAELIDVFLDGLRVQESSNRPRSSERSRYPAS
jgi:AcrR family transcriptional regulator